MRIFATVAATMFCIFALMTGVDSSAASKSDSSGSRTAVLLEDFATLRTNDDGSKLWGAYRGENPNQEAKLDTGAFRIEVGDQEVAGRGSGAYLHFSPYGQQGYKTSTELSKDASGNPVPTAFAKSRIKSGTWDPNCNRLRFWVKCDKDIKRRADNGSLIEFGSYVRSASHGEEYLNDRNWAGVHYYHNFDPNLYAGRWSLWEVNRVPQHRVNEASDINWPEDPEWRKGKGVHYFDRLTRFYIDDVICHPNMNWWYTNFEFDTVAGEPDTLVASVCCTYNGSAYELTWSGPKGRSQAYTVAYAEKSMKESGFESGKQSHRPVQTSGSSYSGVLWVSPPMPERDEIYFAIMPEGEKKFAQIRMLKR